MTTRAPTTARGTANVQRASATASPTGLASTAWPTRVADGVFTACAWTTRVAVRTAGLAPTATRLRRLQTRCGVPRAARATAPAMAGGARAQRAGPVLPATSTNVLMTATCVAHVTWVCARARTLTSEPHASTIAVPGRQSTRWMAPAAATASATTDSRVCATLAGLARTVGMTLVPPIARATASVHSGGARAMRAGPVLPVTSTRVRSTVMAMACVSAENATVAMAGWARCAT